MISQYPGDESAAAREGTRLHALAAQMLTDPINVVVSEQDRRAIEVYTRDVLYESKQGGELMVEQQAKYNLIPGLEGTPDAALLDQPGQRLVVWDYKSGWNIVEAVDNWQLLSYACMLCPAKYSVDLRIAQPNPHHRDGPIRSWKLTWSQLMAKAVHIRTAFEAASKPGAPLSPGRHCLYCEALSGCDAARDVSLRVVEMVNRGPQELPDDFIGRELMILREAANAIKLRLAALEETAASRLYSGRGIAGVRMREGRGGRTNWAEEDDVSTIAVLKMLTGEDYSIPKLPTPKQLLAAHPELPPEVVRGLTIYKPGKMVVSTDAHEHALKSFGSAPNLDHVGARQP